MSKAELRLTDTGNEESQGLKILALDLYVDGNIRQTWRVNSGAPGRQNLRKYTDPKAASGSLEPIPEGIYNIGNLEFAGGKFDWVGSWGSGLGDLWASITYYKGETGRSSFGFHLDENRGWAPGSAGCVVFRTKADAESWVQAMRKYDPAQMVVDWGLGSVPAAPKPDVKPAVPPKVVQIPTPVIKKNTIQITGHSGKLSARLNGGEWFTLDSIQISADYAK